MSKLFNTTLICGCILTVLWAGLWPFSFSLNNNVTAGDNGALCIADYSVVISDVLGSDRLDPLISANRLAVFVTLVPAAIPARRGNGFILSCSRPGKQYNFALAQNEDRLIFFVKTDQAPAGNSIHILEIPDTFSPGIKSQVAAEINNGRLNVWINGVLRSSKQVPGSFAAWDRDSRIYLGNEASGQHQWRGQIENIFIGNGPVHTQAPNVKAGERAVLLAIDFSSPITMAGIMNNRGFEAPVHFIIPKHFTLPNRSFLGTPEINYIFSHSGSSDCLVNVIGFVPVGVFILIRIQGNSVSSRKAVMTTLLVGASLSLIIETIQLFIPLRDSSLLDLALNTIGTMIGALVGVQWLKCTPC